MDDKNDVCRLQHNKKYLRRQARKMQEQSRQNREQYAPQTTSFIPRTDRIPPEASHQLSPAEFAEILIKKLEKVKREQELDEKLNKKLELESMVSQGSNRSLADMLREKLIVTEDQDDFDQSILDDHVSRIWTDKTPLRSPGDPSGRPRSPGYRERSREAGPGRGHSSLLASQQRPGAMGPPAPVRRSVAPGGGQRPGAGAGGYHQDLAYYDLGGGGGQVAGAGVNERVREWMLDVERHAAPGDQDQRSHSGRQSGSKTSPRAKARQQQQLSSSWAHPPQETAADKRRQLQLGASLAMPPPQQPANTLRKPGPGPSLPGPGEVTVAGETTTIIIINNQSVLSVDRKYPECLLKRMFLQCTPSAMRKESPCLTGSKSPRRMLLCVM